MTENDSLDFSFSDDEERVTINVFAPGAEVPQAVPVFGKGQSRNNAGGYAWTLDDWDQLDRFLVLGAEGGTYYVNQQALVVENAEAVLRCIQADGQRVVRRIVEISVSGRAPKNDPALFALAMAVSHGDEATRQAACSALPEVARIGTHLFSFLEYANLFRGWGRGLKRAVGQWYNQKPARDLAYQVVKYQQRGGWSHRDALRLSHPKGPTEQHEILFHWITQGWEGVGEEPHPDAALQLVWAFERAKLAATEAEVIQLVQTYGLPWEALPTQWLGSAAVWEALLPRLPIMAMVRNLGRMSANGLLAPFSAAADEVVRRLGDGEALNKARLHPIAVLAALVTYRNGGGVRGKLTWEPVPQVMDALDAAFYSTFQNVAPTGKRIQLALDISSSMTFSTIAGIAGLTPREASAALALVTASVEPHYSILGFSHNLVPLAISAGQRLDDVVKYINSLQFGGTDCALPIVRATKEKIPVEAFVVYTDSETWAGEIHPFQALEKYRQKMGIPAKLVVVGMTASRFTIANPQDPGMLDVVGFDTATPQLISDFIAS